MSNYLNTPETVVGLPMNKIKALKSIRVEMDNIQDYVIDTYMSHVFNKNGTEPFVEVNIEDMTADELKQIAYDINVLYDKLEQTMSKLYK